MDIAKLLAIIGDFFKNFNIGNLKPSDIILIVICIIGIWVVFKILGILARLVSIAVFIFILFFIYQKSRSGDFSNIDIIGIITKDVQIALNMIKGLIAK